MILYGGPADAISFTDDTSLDTRKTAGSKVSIHCQVLRERPLDWHYSLRWRAPHNPGELKSGDVTAVFLSLSEAERRNIFCTLKSVRVHITDPRPYIADVDQMLARVLPRVNARDFLARLEQAQKKVAEPIQRKSRQSVARRMLMDSPAERLKLMHRAVTRLPEFPEWMMARENRDALELDSDITAFEDRKARINIKEVSVSVSKSGSVFFPALDRLEAVAHQVQWPATAWHFWSVNRALAASHAFDDGNRKAVRWIDGKRTEVLSKIDPYLRLGVLPTLKPLEVISSTDSYFIQAADIAAGIVRTIWERQTLVHVVRAFEYVTYNGTRISNTDAARITASLSNVM